MRKNKWIFIFLVLILFTTTSQVNADVQVNGYFRKDGTYVQPHYRSNPDGLFFNNFSTYGNVNPYTGKIGTKRYLGYPNYNYFSNYYFYSPFANSDVQLEKSLEDYSSSTMDSTTDTTSYSEQSRNINDASNYITAYDTSEQIEAKKMLVDYFNNINTRSYIPAYSRWDSSWQSEHPYGTFENGYVDVINKVDTLTAIYNTNGITLEGTITAEEGWEQTNHKYQFDYNAKKINGTWKLTKGKLIKLW